MGFTKLITENGWRQCDRAEIERIRVPEADDYWSRAMTVRKGDAFTVLEAAARYYHRYVEPLDRYRVDLGDDWGWSATNVVSNSNHLSATALDFNATQYCWGTKTMPAERVAKCNQMLRDFEGCLFWGRNWNKPDEMHWQIGVPEFDADGVPNRKLAAFAQRLRDGYLGLYAPPDPDAFPLPSGYAYGPLEGPDWCISGKYHTDTEAWRAGLARFQRTVGIDAPGVWTDETHRIGVALQIDNGWPITGMIFQGEWDAVIRHGQRPVLTDEPLGMEYADVSQYQSPVNHEYPHPFLMFRANNGSDVDGNFRANYEAACAMVNDPGHPLRAFGVYSFWRPNEDTFGGLNAALEGTELHPKATVMVDVESGRGSQKGEVRGDQSDGVRGFLEAVRGKYGGRRMLLGYYNRRADPDLWQNRPTDIRYVVPDYSAQRGSPRYPYDGWLIHQFTDKGRCAPWGGANVDLNYYGGTTSSLLRLLGLEEYRDPDQMEPPDAPELGGPDQTPDEPPTEPQPDEPEDAAFPLPEGMVYGPQGREHCISGFEDDLDPAWRDGLAHYQRAIGLAQTGLWELGSPVDLKTRTLQENFGWPISGYVGEQEWNLVMNRRTPAPQVTAPKPGNTIRRAILTGPNTSAARFGVGGTDLGIGVHTPDRLNSFIFGDTFEGFTVGGAGWRSPVMLKSTNWADYGLDFDSSVGGDYARQLWDYPHNNETFSTVLPADVLRLGDRIYLYNVVVQGLERVVWNEIAYSDDSGHTWRNGGPQGQQDGNWQDGYQRGITWCDGEDGYIYILGSRWLTDGGGSNVRMWRCAANHDAICNRRDWEPWGWNGRAWGWGYRPADMFPVGRKIREMSLRRIDGRFVLVYTQVAPQVLIGCSVVNGITDNWHTAPTTTVVRNVPWSMEWLNKDTTLAQPYGGFIAPSSTLDRVQVLISQWNTSKNWPYRTLHFEHAVHRDVQRRVAAGSPRGQSPEGES